MSAKSVVAENLWERLAETYKAYVLASKDFFSEEVDRVTCLKLALRGKDRFVAISMTQFLNKSEIMELFEELVFLASFSHGSIQAVRDLILSLPRDWVLAKIEAIADPILAAGDYDEYRRFLELYADLDHSLAFKLATRAAQHEDEDIKEAGEDFLEKLMPEAESAAAIHIIAASNMPFSESTPA